ncbi:expressed unknown protein [Ectocarpus siliculosus]|uniref:Uncharacterized protein n=1 Tax=Ectocarpus siliculosus TaxID=2880 RepID=D8LSX0_ECTSI|nr:expressed unknown protein [Ectocarpus siliculosus]|eukprot:CBN77897.1 expressed unknown protein [Ectocarpus siliculosus]
MLTASVWAGLAPEPAATATAAGLGGGRGKGYHKGRAIDAFARGREIMRGSEGAGRAPAGVGAGREAAAPPEARVVGGAGDGGEGRMLRRRRQASERGDVGRADLSGQAERGEPSLWERQERGGHAAGTRLPPSEGSTALADDAARRRGDSRVEGRHPAPPTNLGLLRTGGAAATFEVTEGPGREGLTRRRTQSRKDEGSGDAEEWPEEEEEDGDENDDSFGSSGLLALLGCFGLFFCVMEVAKCYFLFECRRRQRWRQRRGATGDTRQMPIASSRVVAPEPPDDGMKDEWVEVVVDGVWMSGDVPGGEGLPSATGYAVAGASHALHDAIEHARRLSPGTGYRAVFAPPAAPPPLPQPQPQAEMSEMSRDDVPPHRSPPVSAAPFADMTDSTQR